MTPPDQAAGKLSRRALLGALILGAGAAGCSTVIDNYAQPDLPDTITPPGGFARHPIAHLLSRATYGLRPGEIEAVEQMGRAAWLDQQLDYNHIDDGARKLKLRRYDTLNMTPRDLLALRGGDDKRYVRDELAAATLTRAIYSKRQLYEVMVGFWSDHFSVYHFKGDVAMLKTVDDRDVIRRHALGTFGDLLRASAHSPAMLVYLDNVLNEKSHPNENYAREVMELHTLGVDGGYTERDIQEVARCLTGWSVNRRGEFTFVEDWHDYGAKTVLGHTIPAGGGKSDGDQVLDILLAHPSTPRFVSAKLVRRFVADDPPASIVDACVETWHHTDGDIRALVRTIFTHPEFDSAPPKLKRPMELVVSLLRTTNAQYDGGTGLVNLLDRLGHRPFGWPTPDGYPDTAVEWSGNMLGRWNFGLDAMRGSLPDIEIDLGDLVDAGGADDTVDEWLRFFGRLLLKHDLDASDAAALREFAYGDTDTRPDRDQRLHMLGLMVGGPAFQWR
jgi:uncharacterized protein (DUF1800 family)